MSWWRHCSAAVPGPTRAALPFQAMSGLGDTLKITLKEASSMWGSAKANAYRCSWGFPLLPLYSCLPTSGRREIIWLLNLQRHPGSWMMDLDMPPAPSSPHPIPAVSRSFQRSHWGPRAGTTGMLCGAARGGCHQLPSFLQSPSSLGKFWDKTSPGLPKSTRAAGLHEREHLQGFLFQLDCFGFPLLFSSTDHPSGCLSPLPA